jgi:hypothetical protein
MAKIRVLYKIDSSTVYNIDDCPEDFGHADADAGSVGWEEGDGQGVIPND